MNLKTILRKSTILNAEFLFLICLLVGYVVSSALPQIFNLQSRTFSIPYRIFIFLFSVFILTKNLICKKIDIKPSVVFCLFWFFYFFKIVYSFHTDYYSPDFIVKENEIYIRIILINLFPCLALLSVDYRKVDFKYLIQFVFWILFIMLFLNLLYTLLIFKAYNSVSGIFSVYYISSGHYGATLVILSIYYILFRKDTALLTNKKVLFMAILLGIFAIYISAARGPVLALVVVSLYFLILKKKIQFFLYFFLFLLFSVVLLYVLRQFLSLESAFIERNYLWIFEGYSAGREPYLLRAIAIFQDNILIGGRVLYEDGIHPHNIFLALLMAGGLVLLLLFFLLFYPLLFNISYFLKTSIANYYILPLFAIWLQYFTLYLTSTDIHSNPEFWYFSCLLIGLSIKTHNEKT